MDPSPTQTSFTLTSSAPTAAQTTGGNGRSGSGGSNPLLFFVALGFGVIFTNLWIIVGVKYCFRYNARQRARANGEDDVVEIVDLNQPTRPHRRRREKKLMSIEEVNERFPTTRYKSWRAQREVLGLSTTTNNAGATGVKEGDIPVTGEGEGLSKVTSERRDSADGNRNVVDSTTATATTTTPESKTEQSSTTKRFSSQSTTTTTPPTTTTDPATAHKLSPADDSDEEDDTAGLPYPTPTTSGDTCAICLDTLEDDDEIRGLTCNHAFHSTCLDPWLTSRRASCPLCKADYYTPKPRSDGDDRGRASQPHQRPLATPPAVVLSHVPFHRRLFFAGALARHGDRAPAHAVAGPQGGGITATTVTTRTVSPAGAGGASHQATQEGRIVRLLGFGGRRWRGRQGGQGDLEAGRAR